MKLPSLNSQTVLDLITIAAGLGLALSPWYLGLAIETYAAWSAMILGGAIAVFAAAALVSFHPSEQWANLALGIWASVAPWVFGFSEPAAAAITHVVSGLVAAAAATARLWGSDDRPWSAA